MARCCGGSTCSCVVEGGDYVDVSGVGTDAAPYVISVDPDLLLDYQPGLEIGYDEVVSTTTYTATAAGSQMVPGLSITVVGTGRPVDVEFFAPSVRHSVASTDVSAGIRANGSGLVAESQLGTVSSPSTTVGRSLYVKERVVLADGVSYTFDVTIWSGAAGTATLVAAGYVRVYLAITNR